MSCFYQIMKAGSENPKFCCLKERCPFTGWVPTHACARSPAGTVVAGVSGRIWGHRLGGGGLAASTSPASAWPRAEVHVRSGGLVLRLSLQVGQPASKSRALSILRVAERGMAPLSVPVPWWLRCFWLPLSV